MDTSVEISAGTYRIDPRRSVCRLVATHAFGLKPVTATMALTGGTVTVAALPEQSIASAELDAASFTSDDPRRDRDIRGRRFLDVAAHPEIGFRSTRCRRGPGGWQLAGVLAVRGGSCEVVLDLSPAEVADDGYRMVAAGVVDRMAAGVRAGRGIIARNVEVRLEIHAVPVRSMAERGSEIWAG
ncbi:YceI family protein [Actinoplanes sp. OR16]|uniref:YceI family protein n=1 Tax=Actinoplanes sp. OR16 TaxID=946334 RepID=UPI000FD909CD|nr:YceI family protein [Actinoplanes sp. OR16]